MQMDFHYYATYCAAYLAGYPHADALAIAYSAQFTDECTRTLLEKLKAPLSAATTQSQLELVDARTDPVGLQDITRIWASFHFLPYDLYAKKKHCTKGYLHKYRLICKPNGALVTDTVKLAKDASYQAVGLAMHVLADTWAHANFAGTPSLVINNTNYYFYELLPDHTRRKITFRHSPSAADDLTNGIYTNSIYQTSEHTIMNLGHGRAGHLPDYSFARYCYLPAWGDYMELKKDNPSDYTHAFAQMVYAMRYLRGDYADFTLDTYDTERIEPYRDKITKIIEKRQLDACEDWRAFGEELSGQEIPAFDVLRYQEEYLTSAEKTDTFLGRYFQAALRQKSMVTKRIYESGNPLCGYSVDYKKWGLRGIRDYRALAKQLLNQERRL